MPDFSNPVWSIIGIVATIISLPIAAFSAVVTFRQLTQNRKAISYDVQSVTPIFTINKDFQDELDIRLRGKKIQDAYLIIAKFANTGRASIRPDDFVQPLKLTIRTGKIISVSVSNTEPPELEQVIESINETTIFLKRILLNSKDAFTLQVLVSDFSGKESDIYIDGRVVGVKNISGKTNNEWLGRFSGRSIIVQLGIFSAIVQVVSSVGIASPQLFVYSIGIYFFIVAIAYLLFIRR